MLTLISGCVVTSGTSQGTFQNALKCGSQEYMSKVDSLYIDSAPGELNRYLKRCVREGDHFATWHMIRLDIGKLFKHKLNPLFNTLKRPSIEKEILDKISYLIKSDYKYVFPLVDTLVDQVEQENKIGVTKKFINSKTYSCLKYLEKSNLEDFSNSPKHRIIFIKCITNQLKKD